MPGTILTSTGRYFPFDNPGSHPFDIQDIAHALSHLCRYTGHVREFYSVAQHSVLVAWHLPAHLRLQGLLHDASEAYLGDVASPLKRMLPDYKAIEHRVEQAIALHFGLPLKLDPEVKQADMEALMTERRDLMPNVSDDGQWGWADVEPWFPTINPWPTAVARKIFLTEYQHLTERS